MGGSSSTTESRVSYRIEMIEPVRSTRASTRFPVGLGIGHITVISRDMSSWTELKTLLTALASSAQRAGPLWRLGSHSAPPPSHPARPTTPTTSPRASTRRGRGTSTSSSEASWAARRSSSIASQLDPSIRGTVQLRGSEPSRDLRVLCFNLIVSVVFQDTTSPSCSEPAPKLP